MGEWVRSRSLSVDKVPVARCQLLVAHCTWPGSLTLSATLQVRRPHPGSPESHQGDEHIGRLARVSTKSRET